jgi:hypothetical protein
MSLITIWIDQNNTKVTKDMVDRQIMLHQTPQDEVIVRYTTEKLDNGIQALREDNMLSFKIAKEPELAKEINIKEKLANENKFLKHQAFFSADRSYTHGEKPIKKFTPIDEVDLAELQAFKDEQQPE